MPSEKSKKKARTICDLPWRLVALHRFVLATRAAEGPVAPFVLGAGHLSGTKAGPCRRRLNHLEKATDKGGAAHALAAVFICAGLAHEATAFTLRTSSTEASSETESSCSSSSRRSRRCLRMRR